MSSTILTLNPQPESTTPKQEEPGSKHLPIPTGWRLLIAIPEAKEEFEGGILKADHTKRLEEVSSVVGFVLKAGPDAYQDKQKFPTGAWCKEGDFVLLGAYEGTRFKIFGKEFRMINDDTVKGVVPDPRGYERA